MIVVYKFKFKHRKINLKRTYTLHSNLYIIKYQIIKDGKTQRNTRFIFNYSQNVSYIRLCMKSCLISKDFFEGYIPKSTWIKKIFKNISHNSVSTPMILIKNTFNLKHEYVLMKNSTLSSSNKD
jgi:hypothetical protein